MKRSGSVGLAVMLLGAMALSLEGCSSLAGSSTYGSSKLDRADISGIGDYTADRAL